MHGIGYWILHYLFAAVSMFLVLVGIDYASGVKVETTLVSTLVWAVAAAAIFTFARYYQTRKYQAHRR